VTWSNRELDLVAVAALFDHVAGGPAAAVGPEGHHQQREHQAERPDDQQDQAAVWMSRPLTLPVTAYLRIAPIAIRKMEVPMYTGWECPSTQLWKPC